MNSAFSFRIFVAIHIEISGFATFYFYEKFMDNARIHVGEFYVVLSM